MGLPFRDEMSAALERIARLQEENARLRSALQRMPEIPRRRPFWRRAGLLLLIGIATLSVAGVAIGAMGTAATRRAERRSTAQRSTAQRSTVRRSRPHRATAPFDRAVARQRLDAVNVHSCAVPGVHYVEGLNDFHLTITFARDGRVSRVVVDTKAGQSGIFDGTREARCVAARFRTVRIPAFSGPSVSVGKTVRF